MKKRPAFAYELTPSTRVYFERRGALTFVRGRLAFSLPENEARKLREALNDYDAPSDTPRAEVAS